MTKIKTWINKNSVQMGILWAILAGCVLLFAIANIFWLDHILDSDYATQMNLSKLCAEEKSIISTSWIYGNELRLLNTQIVYGFLFLLFSDWHVVRMLGNFILLAFMMLSFLYMVKPLRFTKKAKLLACIGMLLPYSLVDLSIIYMSADYNPPIVLSFLVIGAILRVMGTEHPKNAANERITATRREYWGIRALTAVLACIAGASGLRFVLILIAPLALQLGWEFYVERKVPTACWWDRLIYALIPAAVGLGFNVLILNPRYGYHGFAQISFLEMGDGKLMHAVEETISAFLRALGYASGSVISGQGILNILLFLFLLTVALVVSRWLGRIRMEETELRKTAEGKIEIRRRFVVRFFLFSVLTNVLIFALSDERMLVPRYLLPILIFLIPVLAITLYGEKSVLHRWIYFGVIAVFFLGGAARCYYSMARNDYNAERYPLVEALQEENLHFGYASPWNAGILTELSDGDIEMVAIYELEKMNPLLECMPKAYLQDAYTGQEKFLLLTTEELESIESEIGTETDKRAGKTDADESGTAENAARAAVEAGTLFYQDENFVMYRYDASQQICKVEDDS